MSKLFDLSGKTALLTGASKGMGLAMATALAEHGAKVVISARKQEAMTPLSKASTRHVGRNWPMVLRQMRDIKRRSET